MNIPKEKILSYSLQKRQNTCRLISNEFRKFAFIEIIDVRIKILPLKQILNCKSRKYLSDWVLYTDVELGYRAYIDLVKISIYSKL